MHTRAFTTEAISPQGLLAVREYRFLEEKVRRLIADLSGPLCAACSGGCCATDICVESNDSYWLNLIRQEGRDHIVRFDDDTGWLTSSGCGLTAGRPPMCYAFFCDRADAEIEHHPGMQSMKDLSRLMTLTGQRALGSTHLIALSPGQILTRMNFGRLRDRIAASIRQYQTYEKSLRRAVHETSGFGKSKDRH